MHNTFFKFIYSLFISLCICLIFLSFFLFCEIFQIFSFLRKINFFQHWNRSFPLTFYNNFFYRTRMENRLNNVELIKWEIWRFPNFLNNLKILYTLQNIFFYKNFDVFELTKHFFNYLSTKKMSTNTYALWNILKLYCLLRVWMYESTLRKQRSIGQRKNNTLA